MALARHRRFLEHLAHRGFSPGKSRIPLGPCGLCAIPALARMGIRSGKVVGREASLYRKVRSVQVVRCLLEGAAAGEAEESLGRLARSIRDDPEGCREGYSCYYREARREG